jgi:small neutral amino acid transporter SnatA (MarC family)
MGFKRSLNEFMQFSNKEKVGLILVTILSVLFGILICYLMYEFFQSLPQDKTINLPVRLFGIISSGIGTMWLVFYGIPFIVNIVATPFLEKKNLNEDERNN